MKKLVRNEQGSTLVWAMTIIMVMIVIITAVLTLSSQYHSRTLYNTRLRQAQISAKATGDLLSKAMNENYDDANIALQLVPKKTEGADAVIEVRDIMLPDKMGMAKATITKRTDTSVTIDVEATYQEVSSKVRLYLEYQIQASTALEAWVIVEYDDDTEKQVDKDETA